MRRVASISIIICGSVWAGKTFYCTCPCEGICMRDTREKLLFAICALSNGRRGERERKERGRTGLRVKWVRQRLKKEG